MARPPRARAAVLDAAERVLLRQGAAALTLDAVAAEAGVSKGGLMYHFPAKQALLEALVARAVEAFDATLASVPEDAPPGAFTRAYLLATIEDPGTASPDPRPTSGTGPDDTTGSTGTGAGSGPGAPAPGAGDLVAALVAAVSQDPELLAPLRTAYRHWQARLERDGIPAAAATTVRLAVDGWWLAALLGLPPLSAPVQDGTVALLLSLTEPAPDQH